MKLNLNAVKCIVKTYIVQMYDNNIALDIDRKCVITMVSSDSIEFDDDMNDYCYILGADMKNKYIHTLTYIIGDSIMEEYPNVTINIFTNSAVTNDKIYTYHTYKDSKWSSNISSVAG